MLSDEQFDKMAEILRTCAQDAWIASKIVTIDKTVYSFQPSAKIKEMYEKMFDKIPVVYIPRKPHPNGLMCYKATVPSSFGDHRPYMYDFK